MNVLVTGGAGYIGSELVSRLNKLEIIDKIIIYDNLSNKQYNIFYGREQLQKVEFILGDILDYEKLNRVMIKIDIVIHLAAFVSEPFNHLQNLQYEQVNTWGTLNVVRAVQNSKSVKYALYLSSLSVYGFKNDIDVKVEKPAPENGYGVSKLKGEDYFRLLGDSHKISILRSANVFGFNNFLGTEGVLNTFIFDSLVYNQIKIYGTGNQLRPFIFIDNLIDKIINRLGKSSSENEIGLDFNASLNELKDWLMTKNPGINFRYINQNQSFPSQSFLMKENKTFKNEQLNKAWESFNKSITIKK